MEFLGWFGEHWPELLQTAGLFLAIYSLREETKERRIQNLFTLTAAHRELWSTLYEKPELRRVLSDDVDLKQTPPIPEEEMFVHFLILHLGAWFKARTLGSDLDDDAVAADIRQFFARPIPLAIWHKTQPFQDRGFATFVSTCLQRRD